MFLGSEAEEDEILRVKGCKQNWVVVKELRLSYHNGCI